MANVVISQPNKVEKPKREIKMLPIAVDYDALQQVCMATVDELFDALDGEIKVFEEKSTVKPTASATLPPLDDTPMEVVTYHKYAFKDNGSNILAVAHCDTINKDGGVYPVKLSDETLVFAQKCDDRLGVYTITCLLPSLGIETDILLTTEEETGNSTASLFKTDKKYNWIVEFDRRGDDAVVYQYGDDGWRDLLDEYFETGYGSFSDISAMDKLNCKAVNIGIGYHDEHAKRSFFVLEEYTAQINRFMAFYDDNREKQFPHETHTITYSRYDDGWDYADIYGYNNYQYHNRYFENGKRDNRDDMKECQARIEAIKSRIAKYKRNRQQVDEEADDIPFADDKAIDAHKGEKTFYCATCDFYFYESETVRDFGGILCPLCGTHVDTEHEAWDY